MKLNQKLKKKLKDRHRLKGPDFSTGYKEQITIIHRKEKVPDYSEKKYYDLITEYNKLKHNIYIKEQRDKEKIKEDIKPKSVKKEINYTSIQEIFSQFFRNKKLSYNYDIKKSKVLLENANRGNRSNRINAVLSKIALHCNKAKAKIDLGQKENESFEGESELKKILNSICLTKKLGKTYDKTGSSETYRKISSRKIVKTELELSDNLFQKKLSLPSNIINTVSSSKGKKSKNIFIDKINEDTNQTFKNKDYDENQVKFKSNIMKRSNIKINEGIKQIFKNENTDSFVRNNEETVNIFGKNHKFYLSSKFKGLKINLNSSQNILNDTSNKNLSDFLNTKNSEENIRPQTSKLIKLNRNTKKIFTLINKVKEKKPIRIYSGSFRIVTNRVQNKPLYTTKIEDLVREFDNIKNKTKKLNIDYKLKQISTRSTIDYITKTKEDMLMFLLKQKFINSKFPQKKPVKEDKKKLFLNKFSNYVEYIDNPYAFIGSSYDFD